MPASRANWRASPEKAAPDAGETIGPHIRAARQAAKMTLAQVALQSGLSVGYLSEVERSRLTPSLSALKKIADVLRIPASKVMFEYGGRAFSNADIGLVRRNARKRISFPHSSKVEIANVWYALDAGDSIYFNSEIAHRWKNDGPGAVEAIWLSTPPSF
jgi:transcriptional regulator with XRE-family HTH domain